MNCILILMILVQILGLQIITTPNHFKLRQLPTWEHLFFWSLKCYLSRTGKKFRFYSTYKLRSKLTMVLCALRETWKTSVRVVLSCASKCKAKTFYLYHVLYPKLQGVPTWRYKFRFSEYFSVRKHQTYKRNCSQTFKTLVPEGGIIIILDSKQ